MSKSALPNTILALVIIILITRAMHPTKLGSVYAEPTSDSATVIIGNPEEAPPEEPPEEPPIPPGFNCSGGGKAILAPNTIQNLLTGAGKTNTCFEASAIIIHWSAQASGHDNQTTYNALKSQGLSCQYGTDDKSSPNGTWQMLDMFEKKIEQSYCTGTTEYNRHGINIEIAGSNFDNEPSLGAYNPPTPQQYERTLELTCFFKRQYSLPTSQIFGHFEIRDGKSDPGRQFIKKFREDIAGRCP